MLRGRRLVVFRLGRHPQPPELLVQLGHEGSDSGLDRAEIVVVQLLSLGRAAAHQRASGVNQIAAAAEHLAVHEKILLFGADHGPHRARLRIAEEAEYAKRLRIQRVHGAQQRRFLVDRFAAVGAERGGNAQHVVLHKGVAGRIPGRIAARLKGGAQSAGGEAGRVRFALDQRFPAELQDRAAPGRRGEKAVMLFGGYAGHRLKPVGEMSGSFFDRPVLHGRGDHVRLGAGQAASPLPRLAERVVDLRGQPFGHDPLGEYHRAKVFRIESHGRAVLS